MYTATERGISILGFSLGGQFSDCLRGKGTKNILFKKIIIIIMLYLPTAFLHVIFKTQYLEGSRPMRVHHSVFNLFSKLFSQFNPLNKILKHQYVITYINST